MALDTTTATASRFQLTTPIVYNGVKTYGLWVEPWFITNPELLPIAQVGIMVVPSSLECRPDAISQLVYGTPYFDWVIIAFNRSFDVLNWPRTGTTIKYPLSEVVYRYLD